MTELEAIEVVSDQYRRDGYTIAVATHAELTSLLEVPAVDLIASKGDEVVLVKVKRDEDQGVKPLTMASGRRDHDYSLTLLGEAERLLMPETRRAALLIAWLAFEAAAREVLDKDHPLARHTPTSAVLIQALAARKLLNPTEAAKVQQATYVCGLLASGVQPTEISSDLIAVLLEAVRKLKYLQLPGMDRIRGGASATVIRRAVNQDPEVRQRVEMADALLSEVVGPSRAEVLADWTLGEDGQGQPVIFLRMSDFTGTVISSFTLDEFEQPRGLKSRLYKIWGELLGFRIEEQLENLIGARDGA